MGAGHTQAAHLSCQLAQHLSTLLYLEPILTEVTQLLVVGGYGGGVYHQAVPCIAADVWNVLHTLLIMQQHALLLQAAGQL